MEAIYLGRLGRDESLTEKEEESILWRIKVFGEQEPGTRTPEGKIGRDNCSKESSLLKEDFLESVLPVKLPDGFL